MMNSLTPRVYGVLGNPVGHSQSPAMQGAAFKAAGINGVYGAFESSDIGGAVFGMRVLGISGMSVTIPFKTAVIPFLDALDTLAQRIGAVNTIVNQAGILKGYNTDGTGAMSALRDITAFKGKRCVLIGAGGAARAIGFMARERGMDLVVANRTKPRGRELADFLKCSFVPLSRIHEVTADVMIQTTPVGMFPHVNLSPVPNDVFREGMVAMDAIYNPLETRFLKEAAARGCTPVGGLEMFVHQGAEQFRLWTGIAPPVDLMRHVVKRALLKESK